MKKIILSLLTLSTLFCLSSKPTKTYASSFDVPYENNAYQICDVQSSLSNLFLGNSIYNSSSGSVRLKNSIYLNNPDSKILTIYLQFKENIENLTIDQFGLFYLNLFGESNQRYLSFGEQFTTFGELKANLERDENVSVFVKHNKLIIQINTSNYTSKLLLGGDELSDNYDHFQLDTKDHKITIERFMLSTNGYGNLSYSCPTVGIGANSEKVYTNNDTISYTINYDNRLSLEEIKQDIIAYDFYDNEQITPTVELDEYSSAVANNNLGTFSVKLKATDTSNNSTTINLIFQIIDTTKPVYNGDRNISIHYTDLPKNNLLDLTQYIFAEDNHDGIIYLNDSYKTYSPKMFTSETLDFTFQDSSGNSINESITITITDNIQPTIVGEDSVSIYQYQFSSINELISKYTISDEGSGIKQAYIESNITDLNNPGEYDITLVAIDNSSNTASKKIKLTIKDGVGPVFFVNVSSLTLTNDVSLTANEIVDELIKNGSIKNINYRKAEFITKSYQENSSKEGSYDTQIVCYDEEGNADYYLVKIKVVENKKSNFFANFYSSMISFFKNLFNQIKKFFELIINFFKRK